MDEKGRDSIYFFQISEKVENEFKPDDSKQFKKPNKKRRSTSKHSSEEITSNSFNQAPTAAVVTEDPSSITREITDDVQEAPERLSWKQILRKSTEEGGRKKRSLSAVLETEQAPNQLNILTEFAPKPVGDLKNESVMETQMEHAQTARTLEFVDGEPGEPNVKPLSRNKEELKAQESAKSFFFHILFLVTSCVIVFSMSTRSAYFLTESMIVSFMDTPFIENNVTEAHLAPTPAPSNATTTHHTTHHGSTHEGTTHHGSTHHESTHHGSTHHGSTHHTTEHHTTKHKEGRKFNEKTTPLYEDEDQEDVTTPAPSRFRRQAEADKMQRTKRRGEGGAAGGSSAAGMGLTLRKATTLHDFWDFMTRTFLDMLYSEFFEPPKDPTEHTEKDDKTHFYTSAMLGVARIRQVRVRSDSCSIHPQVVHLFAECYGYYGSSTEDKKDMTPLKPVHETNIAWIYTPPEALQTVFYYGAFGTYGKGGYYLDLSRNRTISAKRIQELKDNHWIDRGTRAVIIDFTIYNGNVNLFVVCKILAELPPTGGLKPMMDFRALKFLRYVSIQDMVVLGFEHAFIILTVCYAAAAIHQIISKRLLYFASIWRILDLTILALSISAIIMGFYRYFVIEAIVRKLMQKKEEHAEFDFPRAYQSGFDNLCAVLIFLIWIRFLEFFSFFQSMNELTRTLTRSARGIASFTIVFSIIFLAFAQLGFLVFGTEVEEFQSLWSSIMSLLQAVLGKFNYKQLEEANSIMAPIFLILFVFFVFFILVNIFGAIIFESYKTVKTQFLKGQERLEGSYLKAAAMNLFTCGAWKTREKDDQVVTTGRQIMEALHKAGYTQNEIEVFFTRYEIPVDYITQNEAQKLRTRLELRRFDLEPIDTSPEAVAELQKDVKRLEKKIKQQQEESDQLKNDIKNLRGEQ